MKAARPFRKALLAAALAALLAASASAQAKHYALESTGGLRLQHVAAEPAALDGKKGVRITVSDEAQRQFRTMTPEQQGQFQTLQLARIDGIEFSNGVIEAEIAGVPSADAPGDARGFVGIAFRVQPDMRTYDAFYLRPTNGRADDQERRNHAVQYVSEPQWPWFRLRQETPSKYEAYVDLVPNIWTRIKIEIRGQRGRLFVHDQQQATLVVNDLKSGAQGKGGVALWIGPGTVAHFRNLTVAE